MSQNERNHRKPFNVNEMCIKCRFYIKNDGCIKKNYYTEPSPSTSYRFATRDTDTCDWFQKKIINNQLKTKENEGKMKSKISIIGWQEKIPLYKIGADKMFRLKTKPNAVEEYLIKGQEEVEDSENIHCFNITTCSNCVLSADTMVIPVNDSRLILELREKRENE